MRLNIAIPEEHVTPEILDAGLEVTTLLNKRMRETGAAPAFDDVLRAGKVKWKPEPPGDEHFDHANIVTSRGHGDCDDLAPWKAADLRASGEDPGAQAVVYKSGPKRWHAVVQRSDGTLEDPSLAAGMRKREGILPPTVGHMFSPHAGAVVGDDGCMHPRPGVALKMHPGGGWVGRVDLPWSDTDYALTALHHAPVASQAIVGSILGACLAADCAGIAREEDKARLMAVCGVLSGDDKDRLCALCGEDAVEGAFDFLKAVTQPLGRVLLSADQALRLKGRDRLDPQLVQQHARAAAEHPASDPNTRRLAELLGKYSAGNKPRPGGLIDAVLGWMHTQYGPVVPDTPAAHARMLLADQTAKELVRRVPALATGQVALHGDIDGLFDDIGHALGDVGKAVGGVVRDVAPVLAPIASAIPGVGPAIGGALAIAGAVAGKLVPKGGGAPSPAQAVAPYSPPAPAPYVPAGPMPYAAPMAMARPVTYAAPAPVSYAQAQPGMPPPPVHVHMAAAPRGAAASAPVHVSAQPGGPVTIRF